MFLFRVLLQGAIEAVEYPWLPAMPVRMAFAQVGLYLVKDLMGFALFDLTKRDIDQCSKLEK